MTQINGNVNTALQYDANGNQTLGLNNRSVAYTSFNLPSKIVQGVNTVTFDYDANHERFRQTASNGTTIYLNPRMDLGGHFEQTTSGGVVENRHTVYAAGKAIAEVVTRGSVKQTRYFHTDHLGSIDAVTDDNAIVLARYAFDPFGNRTALYGNLNTINHGFTGHEQLPDVGSYFYGAKPHAVTQISGSINTALQYDANGNQTLGLNNRTVAYTAFNLPSQVRRAEPWTGSPECYGLVVGIRRITSLYPPYNS